MKSIYSTGIFNATTKKNTFLSRQLITQIEIETPDYYPKKVKLKIPALFDTGATGSVITNFYAEKLGLKASDIGSSYGVSGMKEVKIYDIIFNLNDFIKGIKLQVTSGNLHENDGGPKTSQIGFLIGMDIIGLGDFFTGCYKNNDGKACNLFSFRIPTAFKPIDYLEEVKLFNQSLADQKRRKEYRKKHKK